MKSIKISTILFGMVLTLSGGLQAADKDAAMDCLRGYEWTYQAGCFDGAGEGVNDALKEIAVDSTVMNAYRFRALYVLGQLNASSTTARVAEDSDLASFLETYIQDNPTGAHTRRAFNALSSVAPSRADQAAEALLDHKDAHVRVAAVKSLRKQNSALSRAASDGLAERIAKEDDWVQKLMLED